MRYSLLAQAEGTPWLVATGALTNVALLFATFPEVVKHIKGLSIMGGAIGGGFSDAPISYVRGEGERIGNTTKWAEFNIYVRGNQAIQSILDPGTEFNISPSATLKLQRPSSQTPYWPQRLP